MKHFFRALPLILCLSLILCTLAACADVKGTYARTVGDTLATTYEFDSAENFVKITERVGSEVYEYEFDYEISEDGKFITFYENGKKVASEQFEQGEDYIKIGVIKYFEQ